VVGWGWWSAGGPGCDVVLVATAVCYGGVVGSGWGAVWHSESSSAAMVRGVLGGWQVVRMRVVG